MIGPHSTGVAFDGDAAPRPGSRQSPLTVTALNLAVDGALRDTLGMLWVQGELSRFVSHASGHWYFTLTDGNSAVACAMFRRQNSALKFKPNDGQAVLLLASPGIYQQRGNYQLIVEAMEPLGQGAAALAFEQLKARLAAEGLFDPARKKRLPPFARRIGVVTSRDGAALQDLLRVLRRRHAGVEVLLAPATVQGKDAPREIVDALRALDRRGLDVLIVARGGGAREDLAAFDDESVVRAIAACVTPVVTGIGHEIDITLADFAADIRAATPSQAAELVVLERDGVLDWIRTARKNLRRHAVGAIERRRSQVRLALTSAGWRTIERRLSQARLALLDSSRALEQATRRAIDRRRERLERLAERLSPSQQLSRVHARQRAVGEARGRLTRALERELGRQRRRLTGAATALDTLSPLAVLGRGYALAVYADAPQQIVDDSSRLRPGDRLRIRFARGVAIAEVTEIEQGETKP